MTNSEETDKLLLVLATFVVDQFSSGYIQNFKFNSTTYNLVITEDVVAILDANMAPVNRIFVKDLKDTIRFK